MQNRISPGDTPYLLFGFIFLLLTAYVTTDFLNLSTKTFDVIKSCLLWATVVTVLGSAFFSSMIVRHQTAPIYGVNDIIVQQEAAIRYFVHGKNPYKETYFGTPVESWHYSDTQVNPALYHFVMEPLYLVSPLPLYWVSNHIIGYFDAREALWLLFAGMLVLAYIIPKDSEKKRLFVILLAFNPATLGYVLEGRSDVFVYFFLLMCFYLLEKNKFFWAGVLLGVSFLIKQSSWPILPLYVLYVAHFAWMKSKILSERFLFIAKNMSGFALLFVAVSAPFYFWSPNSYIASTISYLSGNTPHSYPVSGYGFGMILNQLGFIKNVSAYYPFAIWQLLVGGPLLILFSWYLWKKSTVQKLILFYALFLFVFWYFSRYFNNSHVGYISMVLITTYFWPTSTTEA
jgi:hypothetical protein